MRLVTGDDVRALFQRAVVNLKQNHLFSCAVALTWTGDETAPWISDTTLQRLLDMHLTKTLAAEHEKTSFFFFQKGDVLLLGDGLSNAAYLRALATLEDEAVKLGAHPANFHAHAFDLSVEWEAFLDLCKTLHAAEQTVEPTKTSSLKPETNPATLLRHLDQEMTHYEKAFATRPLPTNRKLTLLFVEDEPSIRQLLFALLGDTGHNLIFAANAREAIYEYCRKPPHIAFLDINLPDLSGLQVLELIRKHDANAFTVMLTSHAAHEYVQNAVSNGVGHYVVKPFSRQKLQECIDRFFAKTGQPPV